MSKTVIFDFDGTLADTFPLIVEISYDLSGVSHLPADKIDELRRLPVLKAITKLGISRRLLILRGWQIRPRMHAHMHTAPVFAGIPEMLKQLHDAGYKLLILSSNRERNVRAFLRTHHLEQYFDDVASVLYGNAFFKTIGLHKVLRRFHLTKQECVYIGNEGLDMQAATRVGLRSIAVTWSGHDKHELTATNPTAVIDVPAELLEAIRF
jgi:phosphoglycolate phosphatase